MTTQGWGHRHHAGTNNNNISPLMAPYAGQNHVCCLVCSENFVNRRTPKFHLQTHQNSQYKRPFLTPPNPEAKFTDGGQSLGQHFITDMPVSKEVDRDFCCKSCSKSFASQTALNSHLRSKRHNENRQNNGPDSSNGTSSFSRKAPRNHIKPLPESYEMDFSINCAICDRSFATNKGFIMHSEKSREHRYNLSELKRNSMNFSPRNRLKQPGSAGVGNQPEEDGGAVLNMPKDFSQDAMAPGIDISLKPLNLTSTSLKAQNDIPNWIQPKGAWSEIEKGTYRDNMDALKELWHTSVDLTNAGYRLEECTPREIDGYRRCKNCGSRPSQTIITYLMYLRLTMM